MPFFRLVILVLALTSLPLPSAGQKEVSTSFVKNGEAESRCVENLQQMNKAKFPGPSHKGKNLEIEWQYAKFVHATQADAELNIASNALLGAALLTERKAGGWDSSGGKSLYVQQVVLHPKSLEYNADILKLLLRNLKTGFNRTFPEHAVGSTQLEISSEWPEYDKMRNLLVSQCGYTEWVEGNPRNDKLHDTWFFN